jgi:WD40 repeat protein
MKKFGKQIQTAKQILLSAWFIALFVLLIFSEGGGERYSRINSVAFSPDGAWLAVARHDARHYSPLHAAKMYVTNVSRTVSLFDARALTPGRIVEKDIRRGNQGPGSWLYRNTGKSFDFTDSSTVLAVRQFGGHEIRLYDLDSLRRCSILNENGQRIDNLEATEDGGILAAGHNYEMSLWDTKSGTLLATVQTDSQWKELAPLIAFSPNGDLVATSGADTTRIWEIATGEVVANLEGMDFGFPPEALAYSPTDDLLAVGCRSWVRLYDTNGAMVRQLHTDSVVSDLAFSPDGKELAASLYPGETKFFDVATGAKSSQPSHKIPWTPVLQYTPDGKYLATAGPGGLVSLWNAKSRTLHKTFIPPGRYRPPWWFPMFLIVASAIVLGFRATGPRALAERRRAWGLCPRCAYDLRANEERCPECGEPITQPNTAPP